MSALPTPATELMTYSFTARLKGGMSKEVTAFRRTPGGPWTIKPRQNGRQVWTSLHVVGESKSDLELVKKRATQALEKIAAERFLPAPEKKVKPPKVVTLGVLMDAYENGIGLETKIKPLTAKDNVGCLRRLVMEVLDLRDEEVVKLRPVSVLTAELAEKFQDGRMKAVPRNADEVTKGRARRSADSALNKARSLFTVHAMNVYRKAGLTLPAMAGFRDVPLKGSWNETEYVPIPETIIEAMNREAWTTLRTSQPKTFLTYLLMLRCGLRNSECEHARKSWIERLKAVVMTDGKPELTDVAYLALIQRPGWDGPKNNRNHRVPIAPDVLEEIEKLAGEDYLLGGTPQERWEITHRDVCDFVRKYLPTLDEDPDAGRVKAAYELRKHFGAIVASTQSLDRAAEYLGDRRDTVENHYHAWLQNRTARPLLASELTPNVLAAVAA